MPTLEIKPTQPWLIAQHGNVAKITRRLAVMNLALRGLEADFGPEHADTFRRALIEADLVDAMVGLPDRKSTRLNSSHSEISRMPSSA